LWKFLKSAEAGQQGQDVSVIDSMVLAATFYAICEQPI
jgi:hypothetical protein